MIPVTRPFLPDKNEYDSLLAEIWERKWLTNSGPLSLRLEENIIAKISSENFCLVSNGTMALQLVINQMGLTKEIITTPFSYVATANSILWEKCKPIFVDIDKNSLCIDPQLIEDKITINTQAILGVHVFGTPCDVEMIQKIATKHKLKVIYDAAHAFGVEFNDKPIGHFGDASTFSFHATKIFQMVEGGGVICTDTQLFEKIKLARVFGHVFDEYLLCGINGKASEFHCAMGLCTLPYFDDFVSKLQLISKTYSSYLEDSIQKPFAPYEWKHNFSYYPIILKSSKERDSVIETLKNEKILTRKYFCPSLNELPFLEDKQVCPISEDISRRILCLPNFYELELDTVKTISKLILKTIN